MANIVRQSQYSQISAKALNADSASRATTSSYAVTASHALNSGGSPVTIKDEGVTKTTGVTVIDFTGAGVTATNVGSVVTVNIPGGGGGSTDTGSLVTTSSFNAFTSSINQFTSSYNTGSFSGSFTGSFSGTASWASSASNAVNSQTASFLPVDTYQITASWAQSSSQALTASFVSGAFLQGGNSFGATALLGTNDTQNLSLETNGVARMFISSSGAIGIETTIPSASFHISSSQENGIILESNSQLTGSAAMRITQTGTGSALIVEDSTNPDATAFVIRYDGRVGIGYANSIAGYANLVYPLNVNGTIFCSDFVATSAQVNTINPKDSVDFNLSTRAVTSSNINLKTGNAGGGNTFTRVIISGSGDVSILSGSLTVSGSVFATSSWATNALTASLAPNYVLNSTTSSFATTGSNSFKESQSITGSLVVSGSGATIELYGNKIIVGTVGGDEGGEILLGKPDTNTTLTGSGVTIDSYQNKIRFFEQGGTARGAYIDITACGAGVATNLSQDSISLINNTNVQISTTVSYISFCAFTTNSVEAARQIIVPVAGSIKNLYILTSTSQPAGGPQVCTVRKNGANTALTTTIPASAAAGTFSDTTNSVSVAAGDKLSLQISSSVASSATIVSVAAIIERS